MSISTEIRAIRSSQYLATTQAWYAVPQAIIVMRSSSPSAKGNSGRCTVRVGVDQRIERVANDGRLLEDLLLHEMAVIAFADQRARSRGFADRAGDLGIAAVEDPDRIGR